ncbi:MAG: hypothetical protein Q4P24_06730 [Rhodobacterales bacterium]|nr:hypothetical protein [Rhodobacterales bacterium]
MNVPARIASAWKSAQLLIAFHKDQDGGKRAEPRLWSPKNNVAGVTGDPKSKEAFIDLRGQGDAGDVQIKLHSDNIILRRDKDTAGWTGIQADHHSVSVLVGTVWVTVNGDGSITRRVDGQEGDTSWIEADGAFIRIAPDMHLEVAGDGSRMSRRTDYRVDAISAEGVLSVAARRPLKEE